MKKIYLSTLALFLIAPFFASAAYFVGLTGWIGAIKTIVSSLIPLAFGLCLLAFFWGVALFIFHAGGSESNLDNGRSIMIAGIIGLFVISAIWGIVAFITADLFPSSTTTGGATTKGQPVPKIDFGTPAAATPAQTPGIDNTD